MKNIIALLMLVSLPAYAAPAAVRATVEPENVILTLKNTLIVNDVVGGESVAKWSQKALELDRALKAGEPIYLVLNTPGGSVQAGLEFIDFLKGLDRPVHTITIFAASMGFQIVQALGTRYITNSGTLMAHKAKGGFSGEFPGQIDSRYKYWLERLTELDNTVVSRSKGKLTLKSFQNLYENEHWATGRGSLNEGLADEQAVVRCDKSLNGAHEEEFSVFGFRIQVAFSDCPLITGPLDIRVDVPTDNGWVTPIGRGNTGSYGVTPEVMARATEAVTQLRKRWNPTRDSVVYSY